MSETDASSAGAPAASAPSAAPAGAQGGDVAASAGSGNAPGAGVDAGTGQVAQAEASATPETGEYTFGGRRWPSQSAAEAAFKQMFGRTPQVQRENAALQKRIAELEAAQQHFQAQPPPQYVQGTAQQGPKTFAQELDEAGELQFMAQLAEEKGIGPAFYALAEKFDEKLKSEVQRIQSEAIEPISRNMQLQTGVARFMGSVKPLIASFEELAEDNQDPAALEAQQNVLELVKSFPPEIVAQHPELVPMAAAFNRMMNGIPVSSQAPGSSGSLSARVASAAEAASAAQAGLPLDGTGVPRGVNPARESAQDRIRRENRSVDSPIPTSAKGFRLAIG